VAVRLANPVYRFRVLTLAEGWSFVVLLVFGSLLSRISDIDLVLPLGALHGALFVALVLSLLTVRRRLGWGPGMTVLAFLAAVLPLAPFLLHHRKRDELRRAEQVARPAGAGTRP
jgi:integral membrane protein